MATEKIVVVSNSIEFEQIKTKVLIAFALVGTIMLNKEKSGDFTISNDYLYMRVLLGMQHIARTQQTLSNVQYSYFVEWWEKIESHFNLQITNDMITAMDLYIPSNLPITQLV